MLTDLLLANADIAVQIGFLLVAIAGLSVIASCYFHAKLTAKISYARTLETKQKIVDNIISDIQRSYENAIIAYLLELFEPEAIPDQLATIGARHAFCEIKTDANRRYQTLPHRTQIKF
jgi:hypothetical protein